MGDRLTLELSISAAKKLFTPTDLNPDHRDPGGGMIFATVIGATAFSPPLGSSVARVRHDVPAARMMFGGGGKEGEGNFMDKLKVSFP